jgi:ribosomal-protein-alanine N-acetyltransferase
VSRDETERRLLSYIRHWQRHGFGLWAVAEKNGALIEPTIATRQHQPPHRLLPATSEASTDPELIGFCGLQFVHKSSEIEVGFRFAKRCWGRGLATEAAQASVRYGFERLALDRIIGLTHPDNTASQRVLEKAGLRYEKDAFYYNARVRYYAIERSCFWQS